MRCIQLLGCLAIALLLSMQAHAGGSYGSYGGYGSGGFGSYGASSGGYASSGGSYGAGYGASSGGSSGGGLFAGLRAHLAAKHAGSSGGYASGGSSGGYTAAYASAGSSGGSYGSAGSSGGSSGGGLFSRLHAHIAAKRAARSASHGSSGGYVAAYASSGGASSGGGSSGGSSGGYYSAPAVNYSAPAVYAAPSYGSSGGTSYAAPAMSHSYPVESSYPMQSSPIMGSSIMGDSVIDGTIIDSGASYESRKPVLDDDAALLTVAVPVESAKVTVNGHETTSDGVVRQFMSRGLKDGYLYTYEVVVVYEVDGQPKTDTKTIKLRPGDMERLVFIQGDDAADADDESEAVNVRTDGEIQFSGNAASVETVVKLIVPADAQVTLAGNPTNGEGDVRTFRTNQLAAGQSWEDYTVEVSIVQGDRRVSQQRIVDVAAGSTVELTFDFDAMTVAMR